MNKNVLKIVCSLTSQYYKKIGSYHENAKDKYIIVKKLEIYIGIRLKKLFSNKLFILNFVH